MKAATFDASSYSPPKSLFWGNRNPVAGAGDEKLEAEYENDQDEGFGDYESGDDEVRGQTFRE